MNPNEVKWFAQGCALSAESNFGPQERLTAWLCFLPAIVRKLWLAGQTNACLKVVHSNKSEKLNKSLWASLRCSTNPGEDTRSPVFRAWSFVVFLWGNCCTLADSWEFRGLKGLGDRGWSRVKWKPNIYSSDHPGLTEYLLYAKYNKDYRNSHCGLVSYQQLAFKTK